MPPIDTPVLAQFLHAATASLGDRYGAVLPREAVAEIMQAAARVVLRDTPPEADAERVAGQVVARAKADLAMAVGVPVHNAPAPPDGGRATAWTYLLDGVAVVRAVGAFDLDTHQILRQELARALASRRPAVLVDLGRVSFMDHAGLAAMIVSARAARRCGQRVMLLQVPDHVGRLIQMSGVAGEFADRTDTAGRRPAAPGRRAG
jgi:anti-anti-sigma factor